MREMTLYGVSFEPIGKQPIVLLKTADDDARRRLARRIVKEGLTVRSTERAAREGGAKRRPRKISLVDPALADRARAAAERLTGLPSRVTSGALHVRFGDETSLEELVEALEAAAP